MLNFRHAWHLTKIFWHRIFPKLQYMIQSSSFCDLLEQLQYMQNTCTGKMCCLCMHQRLSALRGYVVLLRSVMEYMGEQNNSSVCYNSVVCNHGIMWPKEYRPIMRVLCFTVFMPCTGTFRIALNWSVQCAKEICDSIIQQGEGHQSLRFGAVMSYQSWVQQWFYSIVKLWNFLGKLRSL